MDLIRKLLAIFKKTEKREITYAEIYKGTLELWEKTYRDK